MPQRENNVYIHPVVVHIRRPTVEGERHDLCAVFQFPTLEEQSGTCLKGDMWTAEADIPEAYSGEGQSEQSVFVRVVKISQKGEEGRESWVRSIVRLQSRIRVRTSSLRARIRNVDLSKFAGESVIGKARILKSGGGCCRTHAPQQRKRDGREHITGCERCLR